MVKDKETSATCKVTVTPIAVKTLTLQPMKQGETKVTVSADGLTDECMVTITKTTGVDSLLGEIGDISFDVYDINGRLIMKQTTRENLNKPNPGAYIVRQGSDVKNIYSASLMASWNPAMPEGPQKNEGVPDCWSGTPSYEGE